MMDGDIQEEMIFSNDPADYNRVVCHACTAYNTVKIHHMKKHLDSSHNMSLDQYKLMFGSDWEFVRKVYHRYHTDDNNTLPHN